MKALARLFLPILILIVCPGCDKRAPLRTELESAEVLLQEKRAEFATTQTDAKNLTASLGAKGSGGGPAQIERLNKELTELQARGEETKKLQKAAAEKNDAVRAETQAYRAKHSKF